MGEGFKINSDATLSNAREWLTVLYKKHKYVKLSAICGKRSLDQNALVYKWYASIAEQKEDITPLNARYQTKLHIGVPILLAENEAFAAHWNKFVRYTASYEEKIEAMKFVDVTSIMSSQQMTKYLDQMVLYWRESGVFLESVS